MVVSYTTISEVRIKAQALSVWNTSRVTYGVPSDTKLRPEDHIEDAIKTVDGLIYNAIKNNKNHYLRNLFKEQLTVTDGQEVTDTFLGGVLIDDIPGSYCDPDDLAKKKRNKLNLASVSGYYTWHGSIISFTGGTCVIDVILSEQPSFPMTPVTLEACVFCGVMAIATPKEQAFVPVATHYGNLWQIVLRATDTGDGSALPDITLPRL